MDRYVAVTALPVGDNKAFDYHERPGALGRLIPPWKKVQVEASDHSLCEGSTVILRIKVGPKTVRWIAQHTDYDPPHRFKDTQLKGPFRHWEHEHRMQNSSGDHCELCDDISYRLPLGELGRLLGGRLVRKELESMFAYRHRVTRDDLAQSVRYPIAAKRIAISGASGLVGTRLAEFLSLLGHHVVRLERSLDKVDDPQTAIAPWSDPDEAERLNGLDAVVHLAGKSIASGRWNDATKREIRRSRVELTSQLAASLARLDDPPEVLVCASATGIYGDRADEELTERSAVGDDFLASLAVEWEQSCLPALDAGIRVANARLGLVLDPRGGALAKMLLPARFFGGRLGSGRQWWSWVVLDDVVGAIYHAICEPKIVGPFNVTAATPLTNREFATTLGRVISRPALIPAPAFFLRLALGEMADGLLLRSARVSPSVLRSTGYDFRFPDATEALRYCLGINRLESVE